MTSGWQIVKITIVILALLVIILAVSFVFLGSSNSQATADGLAASFSWSGVGSNIIQATLTNSAYVTESFTKSELGVFWCQRSAGVENRACAPNLNGEEKSDQTLLLEKISLPVPARGGVRIVTLPFVRDLALKQCGRFYVFLKMLHGAGDIGQQVFVIGPDCPQLAAAADICPYTSTQAKVQINQADTWSAVKTIFLGQSVNLAGFHNGSDSWAGDADNHYLPNIVDVEIIMTDPQGKQFGFLPEYPILFTPDQAGTYIFAGRTKRQQFESETERYYTDPACTATGMIQVVDVE